MYQQGYRPDPFRNGRSGRKDDASVRPEGMPRSQNGYGQAQVPPPQFYANTSVNTAAYSPSAYGQDSRAVYYRPEQNAPPPRRGGGKRPIHHGRGKGGRPGRSPLLMMLLLLLLIGGLCGGGYYYAISSQVTPYDEAFVHGVYIDGIDMGGLTAQEGVDKIREHALNRQNAWHVKLTFRGQVAYIITSDMLGMEIKVNEILQQAWDLGHQGNVFERKAQQDALRANPREFFTVVPSADTSIVDDIMQEIVNNIYIAPADAYISAFDSTNVKNPFTYQAEVMGRMFDSAQMKERIFEMVSTMETGEIEIETLSIPPQITVADLMEQTALRASVTTEISTKSDENRTNNIRVALSRLNGKILGDGERLSFNTVVGVRTEKNGFFPAIEYAYGTEQVGIGGGVCQASTTLYLAALKAGLEIVKREPHSDSVSYTPYGQDATVSSVKGHEIDFIFKNNSGGKVYITSEVAPKSKNSKQYVCTVYIYGPSLGDISYKIETITVKKLTPPSPVEDKDTKKEHVTYTDERKFKSAAKEGCVTETYRCTLKNNVEIQSLRELVSTDTYAAKPERWWVGTTRR